MCTEKLRLLVTLNTVLHSLSEPKVQAQVAQARMDLSDANPGPELEYLSAFQQAKVLVRRYRHLCLNSRL